MNGTEAGQGGSDAMYTDQHAVEDMAVTVIGNNAEMNQPGTLDQMIIRSGGNSYHGHLSSSTKIMPWKRQISTRISLRLVSSEGRACQQLIPIEYNHLVISAAAWAAT